MLGLRLKGIRLRVDKGLGRSCNVCSALGLEPAFRRGLGLGVGFKVQVKVNQNRSTCYVIGNTACEGLACEPWPPARHHPTIQWQLQRLCPRPFPHTPTPPPPTPTDHTMGGGGGNARRLTIYSEPGPAMRDISTTESIKSSKIQEQAMRYEVLDGHIGCHAVLRSQIRRSLFSCDAGVARSYTCKPKAAA